MKKSIFKILARINKLLLPSFSKRGLDLAKAKKWQLALIGWRAYITKNALS
ncbi:SsrA-binding protein [Galbibacter sp. EGI 63066]|uniref:SsrA-binding protein n=1 Tax=Galbibacter sp. EGI 63066 TaxID=2993559 RepID=UPI0022489A6E|nr:SsrA-binding protein [Galbibacter sp. EGI 63066]MCX2681581.1 SsrA-binding protein [Galbibacter sp. EGI 63066]